VFPKKKLGFKSLSIKLNTLMGGELVGLSSRHCVWN